MYKVELQRQRKGSLKMEEYLNKIKGLADKLLMAGALLSTIDLVTQTLADLDADYNPIVVQLSDKDDVTWINLQVALLTYESRLEQLNSLSELTLGQPYANIISNKQTSRVGNQQETQRTSWQGQNNIGGQGQEVEVDMAEVEAEQCVRCAAGLDTLQHTVNSVITVSIWC